MQRFSTTFSHLFLPFLLFSCAKFTASRCRIVNGDAVWRTQKSIVLTTGKSYTVSMVSEMFSNHFSRHFLNFTKTTVDRCFRTSRFWVLQGIKLILKLPEQPKVVHKFPVFQQIELFLKPVIKNIPRVWY